LQLRGATTIANAALRVLYLLIILLEFDSVGRPLLKAEENSERASKQAFIKAALHLFAQELELDMAEMQETLCSVFVHLRWSCHHHVVAFGMNRVPALQQLLHSTAARGGERRQCKTTAVQNDGSAKRRQGGTSNAKQSSLCALPKTVNKA
jgi:hypothetical protein